jgi:2-isopropylmalate synthase
MRKIKFFDTTLRDGEQGIGYAMTDTQKLAALPVLDALGLDVLEIGMVTSDDAERLFTAAAQLAPASCIAALCRMKPGDLARTIAVLQRFSRSSINLLCVGSEIHLRDKLRISAETLDDWTVDIFDRIRNSGYQGRIAAILEDASRGSHDWLGRQIDRLRRQGVRQICVADTVGCMVPSQVSRLFARLIGEHPTIEFSAHFHNDLGLATANSLAAIEAGVDEVQVTLGGIGERCGNAALEEVVAALELNPGLAGQVMPQVSLRDAVAACDALYRIYGRVPYEKKPLLGEHAFTTCAGIHQDGIIKAPHVYEMFDPSTIGRTRRFHINHLSSRKCLDAGTSPVALA